MSSGDENRNRPQSTKGPYETLRSSRQKAVTEKREERVAQFTKHEKKRKFMQLNFDWKFLTFPSRQSLVRSPGPYVGFTQTTSAVPLFLQRAEVHA